ncbi:trigger factor [Motilibacter rhizosphaerae]|uniref:Trigger factor n=1 Tax=Motilibacter rhizosphaerae TaxID=598652 RepID=A0A4Q7NRS8_9ACTN|nr:trigger factor [Motilibacter rhizosphaerae]RZS89803.1 trigger factor [Motilibacter rhizosphaerae]
MKTDVETLNPTRVKLTVEVDFQELTPSLDAAYKRIAGQVSIPGFRRGKVPARIIDQRVGRAAVLEEAVNEALPQFYGRAVEETEVAALGQPEVEVTAFADGEPLVFTAEVDVRPEVELPDLSSITVTVDDVVVEDEAVEEQLTQLRQRFGTLNGVERPAAEGDFVSIDLEAQVEGETIEGGSLTGQSYEVGTGGLLEGLDEAVTGLSAGESRTFTTSIAGGPRRGEQAEVTVTVQSVKERELPEADDDFAQLASEFDTLDELKADLRTRLERGARVEQGVAARDKALEALLEQIELPLPEAVVKAEVDARQHDLHHQLERAGLDKAAYLAEEEQTEEEFDAEVAKRAAEAVKAQFVLDALARREEVQVSQEELTEHLVRRSQQYGLAPEQFAQQLMEAGQVPVLVSEVVRGKALAILLEAVTIKDESGNVVDLEELRPQLASTALDYDPEDLDDHAGHDHGDHEGHDHGDHEGHDHGDHEGHDHA